MVETKSTYEPPAASDGYRVLVMRYWPRGVAKDKIDVWEKQLGTPPDLIKQWKAKEIGWPQFRRAYLQAMKNQQEKIAALAALAARARRQTVTLLCGCKDASHFHRTILAQLIDEYSVPSRR
jgi:uncharacterized protein YeaO (DUF488 family)